MDKAISTNRYLGPDFHPIVDPEVEYLNNPAPKQENQSLTPNRELLETRLNLKESLVKIGITDVDFVDLISELEITQLQNLLVEQDKKVEVVEPVAAKKAMIIQALDEIIPDTTGSESLEKDVYRFTSALFGNGQDETAISEYIETYLRERNVASLINSSAQENTPQFNPDSILMLGDKDLVTAELQVIRQQIIDRMRVNFQNLTTLEVTVIRDSKTEDIKTEQIEEAVDELKESLYRVIEVLRDTKYPNNDPYPFEEIRRRLKPFLEYKDGIDTRKSPSEWIQGVQTAIKEIELEIATINSSSNERYPKAYKDRVTEALKHIPELVEAVEWQIAAYNTKLESSKLNTDETPPQEFNRLFRADFAAFEAMVKPLIYKHARALIHHNIREKVKDAVAKLQPVAEAELPMSIASKAIQDLQSKYSQVLETKKQTERESAIEKEVLKLKERKNKLVNISIPDIDSVPDSELTRESLANYPSSTEIGDLVVDINSRINLILEIKALNSRLKKGNDSPFDPETTMAVPIRSIPAKITQVAQSAPVERISLEDEANALVAKLESIPLTQVSDTEFILEQDGVQGIKFELNESNQFTLSLLNPKISTNVRDLYNTAQTAFNLRLVQGSKKPIEEGKQLWIFGLPNSPLYPIFLNIDNKPVLLNPPDQKTMDELSLLAGRNERNKDAFLVSLKTAVTRQTA